MIRRFARPYARAFMDVAQSPQNAQSILAELRRFETARKSAQDLADLLANPGVALDTKMRISAEIGKRLGLSAMAAKIIEVLVRNQRINSLGPILEAWRELINNTLGVAVAQVRSAHELSAEEQQRLQKTLEQKTGKRVELELATDRSLLGGFVATIGSSVYDASVLGRVQRLETADI
jgi:F-type H+-transporting ATPase subunit delta